jgi:multisubunit Na+/H+ antiporter MnhB subunit
MIKMIFFLAFYSFFFIISTVSASESQPDVAFGAFLPLIFLSAILYFTFVRPISRRKGKSKLLDFLVLIPIVNVFYIIWLASQTDKTILEKIDHLEKQLLKFYPRTWKCNCGIINDDNVLYCPKCGIKREKIQQGTITT